nr:bifunctional riboflavin kinase/FAD synthetase [Flavihumibacter rivuli]
MQVHRNIEQLPAFRRAVVTIGTFDGVHRGHMQILDQLKAEAARIGGETLIITFHPHPRRIVGMAPEPVQLLNSLPEKIRLLEAAGIDHLVVVPFTNEFALQSAREYVEDFLVKRFTPHTIIIGYDHRFGKNREGDFHLLEDYASKGSFSLIEIPAHMLEASTVSSTRIRQALLQGDVELASTLLGYPYFFEGTVVKGNQLGRTIGYPTANLLITDNEKLIPANGVYAVTVQLTDANGKEYSKNFLKGMMNIGVRPTVDGLNRVIEVNIFHFNADIYGHTLSVTLHHRLRAEKKFDGLEALKAQLALDKESAMTSLGNA